MVKSLFDFESKLTSLDLNMVVSALLGGVGVINGFDKGLIQGNKLVLTSNTVNPISQPATSLSIEPLVNISHACVARDGSLYINDSSSLEINPIFGNKGRYHEVLLFANHHYTDYSVVNPVSLTAYWNPISSCFYEEVYSNYLKGNLTLSDITNVNMSSIDNLLDKLPFYHKDSMVLLGIYGIYLDPQNREAKEFSLPIHTSKFPTVLPKNDAIIPILDRLVLHQNRYEEMVNSLIGRMNTLEISNKNLVDRLDDAIRRIGTLEAASKG